jgi:hypothetical protein
LAAVIQPKARHSSGFGAPLRWKIEPKIADGSARTSLGTFLSWTLTS